MDRESVDRARSELRLLGDALTEYERWHPDASEVPAELLRRMAAAARELVLTIGEVIVTGGAPAEPRSDRKPLRLSA